MPGLDGHAWFNAALQCMLHVPQLVNFVRDDLFAGCLAHKRKNACDFAAAFSELAKGYWGAGGVLSTEKAAEAFMRVHRSFKGKRHKHDAGEALTLCLDTLHTALGNAESISDHPIAFDDAESKRAWEQHVGSVGYSPILDMFTGQRKHAGEFVHFSNLTMDPADKTFDGLSFTRLPLVLTVAIPGDQFVDYGDELILRDAAFRVEYRLIAVIMRHAGDRWTALAQHLGAWKHFDNSTETTVEDLNNLIQRDAVMLIYKRTL